MSDIKPGYYWARWAKDGPWGKWETIEVTAKGEVLTTNTSVPQKGDETDYWEFGPRLEPPEEET